MFLMKICSQAPTFMAIQACRPFQSPISPNCAVKFNCDKHFKLASAYELYSTFCRLKSRKLVIWWHNNERFIIFIVVLTLVLQSDDIFIFIQNFVSDLWIREALNCCMFFEFVNFLFIYLFIFFSGNIHHNISRRQQCSRSKDH